MDCAPPLSEAQAASSQHPPWHISIEGGFRQLAEQDGKTGNIMHLIIEHVLGSGAALCGWFQGHMRGTMLVLRIAALRFIHYPKKLDQSLLG